MHIVKSLDIVLEIWTQGRKIEGTEESTEFDFCYLCYDLQSFIDLKHLSWF